MKFQSSLNFQLALLFMIFFSLDSWGQHDDHGSPRPPTPVTAAELKPGRYTGWLHLPGQKKKFATVADFYIESPENFKEFPKMIGVFKISLGGYNSTEYTTQTFKNIRPDYDNGGMTFDEHQNDLLMTATVVRQGSRSLLKAQVTVRSTGQRGNLELLEESDEPGDEVEPNDNSGTLGFQPTLDGEHVGQCNNKSAVLQIHTVRGLGLDVSTILTSGLHKNYGITARIGYRPDSLCGPMDTAEWCMRNHYQHVEYNYFTGQLILKGQAGNDTCVAHDTNITCKIRNFSQTDECRFSIKNRSLEQTGFFRRKFNLNASSEEMKVLPSTAPPRNLDLTQALAGDFSGYIHNETTDEYLPVMLSVTPFSSTDNPHNPNQMMVSTSLLMFLDGQLKSPFVVQRFDSRSFYLRPGFVLSQEDSDGFLQVQDWRTGFIRGVWHSHSFGRVGTIQLKKGEFTQLPMNAKILKSPFHEFQKRDSGGNTQWIRFLAPDLSQKLGDSALDFLGSYQLIQGNTPVREIKTVKFDLYTGALGWRLSRNEVNTLGTARLNTQGNLEVFWPPIPLQGVIGRSYKYLEFQKIQ